jgi:hypothetical protein
MFRVFLSLFLFSFIVLFTVSSYTQTAGDHPVVLIQTWKLKLIPVGEDETALTELLQRWSDVLGKDPRLVNMQALRHSWGADSRDLLIISEFKNRDDLFSFFQGFNDMLTNGISKEQLDKDNALWEKFVGQHSDEIYHVTASKK